VAAKLKDIEVELSKLIRAINEDRWDAFNR
jgi:hypothetical protein